MLVQERVREAWRKKVFPLALGQRWGAELGRGTDPQTVPGILYSGLLLP